MADKDRAGALREELLRLDAETADGERNADDVADKARRRAEIVAEMERTGVEAPRDGRPAATYRDPP